LASFRHIEPFEFRDLSGTVFQRAIEQHLAGKRHCRSLDRLHLAAMDQLGQRRLLTNDAKQAAAARALNYEVVVPGASWISKDPSSKLTGARENT
jgi:predicted nucleic acid-binding protein